MFDTYLYGAKSKCRGNFQTSGYTRLFSVALITSRLPIDKWREVIGDPTFADAILDRLVHNAYRLDFHGEYLRKTKARKKEEHAT